VDYGYAAIKDRYHIVYGVEEQIFFYGLQSSLIGSYEKCFLRNMRSWVTREQNGCDPYRSSLIPVLGGIKPCFRSALILITCLAHACGQRINIETPEEIIRKFVILDSQNPAFLDEHLGTPLDKWSGLSSGRIIRVAAEHYWRT
jgi:hypothetical protein